MAYRFEFSTHWNQSNDDFGSNLWAGMTGWHKESDFPEIISWLDEIGADYRIEVEEDVTINSPYARWKYTICLVYFVVVEDDPTAAMARMRFTN